MGYSLRIGEATICPDITKNEDWAYSTVSIKAGDVRLDNAPAFGEPTDYTNSRWPSYTAWANFVRFIVDHVNDEFEQLFYLGRLYGESEPGSDDYMCLIKTHPGVALIHEDHKSVIDRTMQMLKEKFPDAEANYDADGNEHANGALCRLTWLKFWIDWALENCKIPVFENS